MRVETEERIMALDEIRRMRGSYQPVSQLAKTILLGSHTVLDGNSASKKDASIYLHVKTQPRVSSALTLHIINVQFNLLVLSERG